MAEKGISLNPGADPTLVNAAYAAAMANVPKDLSGTFEALATNYADTMEIVGANWAAVAKTVGGWANEAGQNFIAGQKLLNKGLVIENANGVKFLYNALKNNRKEMRQTWFGGGNPWSPENAEKRLLLQQTQEKLTAQIELLDTGWDGMAGQVAAGEVDEEATGKNWQMVNAIGAYKSSSGKTKDGDYIVPDHDENGDIILTLYNNGEPVADKYGRNITTTPTEMENLVVLNNENRDTNINTHYKGIETSAKSSNSKASFDHFLPQFRGKMEKEVKGKNNLLGAINTKNYIFTETFVEDYTNPGGSVASAEVFGMISKIKLVADDGSRLEFDEMADGKAGLTEGDFVAGAENYEKIVGALTDQTNKFFDEDVTREAYLDWTESGARKAWDFGVSQRSSGKTPPSTGNFGKAGYAPFSPSDAGKGILGSGHPIKNSTLNFYWDQLKSKEITLKDGSKLKLQANGNWKGDGRTYSGNDIMGMFAKDLAGKVPVDAPGGQMPRDYDFWVNHLKQMPSFAPFFGGGGGNTNPFGSAKAAGTAPTDFVNAFMREEGNIKTYFKNNFPEVTIEEESGWDKFSISVGGKTKTFKSAPWFDSKVKANKIWKWLYENWKPSIKK